MVEKKMMRVALLQASTAPYRIHSDDHFPSTDDVIREEDEHEEEDNANFAAFPPTADYAESWSQDCADQSCDHVGDLHRERRGWSVPCALQSPDESSGESWETESSPEDPDSCIVLGYVQSRHSSSLTTPGPSCVALREAVLKLYRFDDFDMDYLAEGFFSDVYKVLNRVTTETMVLKISKPETSCRRNVLKEVELMNRLRHPNVICFRGVCVDRGALHALTEFCDEGSLDKRLLDVARDFPWNLRAAYALDIARGMQYIHSLGYMHRDLTAMNVLLKKTSGLSRALVGDLGLACRIPKGDQCLPTVGTPYWMAPECLKEEKYDEKADVFSFGIIVCQMAARIDADPDKGFPRTQIFGVDYVLFSELCQEDTPLPFLRIGFTCSLMDPKSRPSFELLVKKLLGVLIQIQSASLPHSGIPIHSPNSSKLSRSFSDAGVGGGLAAGESPKSRLKQGRKTSKTKQRTDEELSERKASKALAQRVAAEDPFYEPGQADSNPFAVHEKFRTGQKIIVVPIAVRGLPTSGSDLTDSPEQAEAQEWPAGPMESTPRRVQPRRSTSLPASPIGPRRTEEACPNCSSPPLELNSIAQRCVRFDANYADQRNWNKRRRNTVLTTTPTDSESLSPEPGAAASSAQSSPEKLSQWSAEEQPVFCSGNGKHTCTVL